MGTLGKIYLGNNIVSTNPSGSIEITENGTVDVENYAEAVVNVSSGGSSAAITNPFNGGEFGSISLVGSMTHQYIVSGGTISRCWLLTNNTPYSSDANFTSSSDLYEDLLTSPYIKALGANWEYKGTPSMLLTINDSGLLTITGNRKQSKVEEYPWELCFVVSVLIELDTGAILYDWFKPYGNYSCFTKGTQITLANGIRKNVEDITYNDYLTVWDFDNGKSAIAKPLWVSRPSIANEYHKITLSDGTVLNLVGTGGKCHRLLCIEDGAFVYAVDMIGKHTIKENGELVEVISAETVNEEVEYYNIITDYHMNLYADDILTSCRYSNLYPIVDMKYVKEEREIIPYEMFDSRVVSRKYYGGLRLGEQTIPIEETAKYIKRLEDLKN